MITSTSFINRKELIKAFHVLLNPGNQYWILVFAGDSGIGKSYLLKYLRDFETPTGYLKIWLDLTNVCLRTDPLALLRIIGETLRPKMPQEAWQSFRKLQIEEERALSKVMQGFNITQQITASGGAYISATNQTAEEGGIILEAEKRARNVLTLALLEIMESITPNQILVFLDSFEWLQESGDFHYLNWLLDELLGFAYGRLSGGLRAIIASRRFLKNSPVADLAIQHSLQAFDMKTYSLMMKSRGMENESLIDIIYEFTLGHPLLTDMVARVWDEMGRSWQLSDIERLRPEFDARARNEWIVSRVASRLFRPFGDLLYNAVILRRFDFEILQKVFPELIKDDEAIFNSFISYPFIKLLPEGMYTFHELVRAIQTNYLRNHSVSAFKRYHRRALKYYQKIAENEMELDNVKQRSISLNQFEILYHLMAVNQLEGLSMFRKLFSIAINSYDITLARTLLQEVKSYGSPSITVFNWLEFYDGLLLYLNGDWNIALNLLLKLKGKKRLPSDLRVDIMEILAELYFNQGHTQVALGYYNESIGIRSSHNDNIGLAHSLSNIGHEIYRALGEWDHAKNSLEQSLAILQNVRGEERGLARTMLQLGNLYRLQSRWDQAVQFCQESINLYEQIGNEYFTAVASFTLGRTEMQRGNLALAETNHKRAIDILSNLGADYSYGMALRNLGDVYRTGKRYDEAELVYRNSLYIFNRLGAQIEWARVMGDLGTLYFEKGIINEAVKHYEICISKKRELDDTYGVAFTSYYLGNLWRSQEKWAEAIESYQTALNTFQYHPNVLKKTETIIGLGYVYRSMGKIDQIVGIIEEVVQIAQELRLATLSELYYLQGYIAISHYKFDDAILSFTKAVQVIEAEGDLLISDILAKMIVEDLDQLIQYNFGKDAYHIAIELSLMCKRYESSKLTSTFVQYLTSWMLYYNQD